LSTYSTSRTKPEAHTLSRSSIYKHKAGRRGRHASQQEAQEGTQASRRQRDTLKAQESSKQGATSIQGVYLEHRTGGIVYQLQAQSREHQTFKHKAGSTKHSSTKQGAPNIQAQSRRRQRDTLKAQEA